MSRTSMEASRASYPGEAGAPREEVVDLVEILHALRARTKLIVGVTLFAFLASLAYVMVATPSYQGSAQILLESRETSFTRPVETTGADTTQRVIDELAVASQVQVVRSRDVAREVARRLELVGNPEFDPAIRPMNPLARVLDMLGMAGAGADDPNATPEDRVLEEYYDRLLVFAVGRSRIIAIEFQSRDPELAARAANTIAEVYLETLESAKIETARSASGWLSQNIERLRDRVREAEARVEEFRSGTGLLVGSNNATLTTQQLGDLSAQLAAARSQQADSEARAALIRDLIESGRAFEIPEVANDGLIQSLIQERVALRASIAAESRTLLPQHPRILALEAQLADLDGQIRGAAERTVRALENEARLAGARVDTLSAALERQMDVASRANENEVQLRALEREARAEREQLEVFLGRYRDAIARDSEEATLPDARIVSRAATPEEPIWPKAGPMVVLATIAGLVATVLAIIVGTIVFEVLRPSRAVASEPAMPFARRVAPEPGVEPPPESTPPDGPPPGGGRRIASDVPLAAAAATSSMSRLRPAPVAVGARAFDVPALASRIAREPIADRGRRILVTSLEDADTARTLAAGLAEHAGQAMPTLVVGLDPQAGDAPAIGFADLVAGEASFFEVIERVPGERAHRVGAGAPEIDPLDPDWEDELEITLSAFDQTYDTVVLVLAEPKPEALPRLAPRTDVVVLAAGTSADDPALVALYERVKADGARDVVVALAADAVTAAA